MEKTDFKGLASLCVQKYKDSLDNERERYVDTLFVAITEKESVRTLETNCFACQFNLFCPLKQVVFLCKTTCFASQENLSC